MPIVFGGQRPHATWRYLVARGNCLLLNCPPRSGDFMVAGNPLWRIAGVVVPSNLAIGNLGTTQRLVIVLALLTTVFWGNILRFYPRLIDRAYDDTSIALVVRGT